MDNQKVIELEQTIISLEEENRNLQRELQSQSQHIKWFWLAILLSIVGCRIIIGFLTLPFAIYYLAKTKKRIHFLLEKSFYTEEEIFYCTEELIRAKQS